MSVWRLISLMTSLIGARVLGAAFGFMAQLILARTFPRDDVGVVFLAMSATVFLSLVMTGGYPALGVTTLARYQTLGRKSLVNGFLSAALKDSLVLSIVVVAILAAVLTLMPLSSGISTALLVGCIAAPAYAVMRLNNTAANSLRKFGLSYVPDFVIRPALLFLFILLMLAIYPAFRVSHVLWAFVAITFSVTLLQAYYMRAESAFDGLGHKVHRRLARVYRSQALSLLIIALVTLTFADIVTLISGFFLHEADIAVLGVSIRLAALVGFVTQSSQQFVMRDLTAAMARGDRRGVDQLLLKTNALALGAMALALLGAALFGDRVLGLFGADYKAGHWALVLFLVSQTLRAASGMNAHLLSLGGHHIRSASLCFVSVAILVAGIAVLAPRYGVFGVAVATVAAEIVWAISLAILVQRLTGRRGDILAVVRAGKPL